jgi:hypothetical protein
MLRIADRGDRRNQPRRRLVVALPFGGRLASAGGGAGRNWSPLSSTNGVTCPQVVKTGAGRFGGVDR